MHDIREDKGRREQEQRIYINWGGGGRGGVSERVSGVYT